MVEVSATDSQSVLESYLSAGVPCSIIGKVSVRKDYPLQKGQWASSLALQSANED